MKTLFRVARFFCLLLGAEAGLGQTPPPRIVVRAAARLPVGIPLYASINKVPQLLSAEDSLNRRIFARNRVRTMAVLRPDTGFGPDTSEYVELDRRGNKTRLDQPRGGQTRLQRFDGHDQPVELVLTAVPSFPVRTRIVYDAQTRVNSTYLAFGAAAPVLWQQAQEYQRGDTTVTEAVFTPLPELPESEVRRLVQLLYPTGGDTLRLETAGYNQANELVDFSAIYLISRRGNTIENGRLELAPPPSSAAPRPTRLAAVRRQSRQQRPRYVPDTRNEYDARGRLVSTVALFEPPREATASPQPPADPAGALRFGRTTQPFSSFTVRYTRRPDGRVQRQEDTYQLRPGQTVDERLLRPVYTEYEYAANGLLLRKVDNRSNSVPTVYEVKYTYY